jgi:Tfp pilus assembly protein PilZ
MNLLHYKVVDASNGQLGDGMARTLNVSGGGLLLETNTPFEPGQEIAVNLGFEEELVEVVGKVVHCKPSGDGMYATGIQFENLDGQGSTVLATYLELFQAASSPEE